MQLQEFPSPYKLRAIGDNRDDFAEAVLSVVQAHVPDTDPETLSVRPSSGGKYIAVTLTIIARSQAQLEAIHAGLNQLEGLRVLL